MDLLSPNPGTIFWTSVTFLLLLLVLHRLAWKPLTETLDERESRIRESLSRAEQVQKKAEQDLAEHQQMLDKAREEAQELIAKSKKTAETLREEIVTKAKQESDALLERTKNEIALERQKAIDEIRKLAVDLSITATRKAIGRALSQKEHEALIGESMQEMGDLN